MGQSSVERNLNKKGNGHQLLKAKRGDVGALPPPPPPYFGLFLSMWF